MYLTISEVWDIQSMHLSQILVLNSTGKITSLINFRQSSPLEEDLHASREIPCKVPAKVCLL